MYRNNQPPPQNQPYPPSSAPQPQPSLHSSGVSPPNSIDSRDPFGGSASSSAHQHYYTDHDMADPPTPTGPYDPRRDTLDSNVNLVNNQGAPSSYGHPRSTYELYTGASPLPPCLLPCRRPDFPLPLPQVTLMSIQTKSPSVVGFTSEAPPLPNPSQTSPEEPTPSPPPRRLTTPVQTMAVAAAMTCIPPGISPPLSPSPKSESIIPIILDVTHPSFSQGNRGHLPRPNPKVRLSAGQHAESGMHSPSPRPSCKPLTSLPR